MFDKLLDENKIPRQEKEEFLKEAIHPAGAAAGALLGGGYALHQAKKRHTTMRGSQETPYSNKIRHEMEHHLETRMNTDKPSRMDRIQQRLIAGKLRYARLAQKSPSNAMALEATLGAGSGAIMGSQVGTAFAGSKAAKLMKAGSALHAADICGVSRGVLEKKASYLQIPMQEAAELEIMAAALNKKAQVEGLTPREVEFMESMRETQNQVTGNHSPAIESAQRSKTAMDALRYEKKASIGSLLMRREMEAEAGKLQGNGIPPEALQTPEPEDYRAPVRKERRAALSDIFGGPGGLQ